MGNNRLQKENVEVSLCANERVESDKLGLVDRIYSSSSESTDGCMHSDNFTESPDIQPQPVRLYSENMDGDALKSSKSSGVSVCTRKAALGVTSEAARDNVGDANLHDDEFGKDIPLLLNYKPLITIPLDTRTASGNDHCNSAVPLEVSYCGKGILANNLRTPRDDDSEDTDMVSCETSSPLAQDVNVCINGHIHGDDTVPLLDHTSTQLAANNQNNYSFNQTSAAETHKMNSGSLCLGYKFEDASGTNQVELMGDV